MLAAEQPALPRLTEEEALAGRARACVCVCVLRAPPLLVKARYMRPNALTPLDFI